MTIATFDPVEFKARYPEFSSVADLQLSGFFDESGFYLSNTDASPVQDIGRRTTLLWMLTAHIATLRGALNPAGIVGGANPVGRTSSASEGSVSASMDYGVPGTAAWFAQNQYGAAFWQATLSLRSFRYRSRPTVY